MAIWKRKRKRCFLFLVKMEAEAVFLFTLEAAVEAMKMSGSGDIFFKYEDKKCIVSFFIFENFALFFFFLFLVI